MKRALLALILLACTRTEHRETSEVATSSQKSEGAMKISSSAFADGGSIPSKYTCDGSDTSPPLTFEAVPPAAKSLALVVDDPDAPGGTFDHWIAWNIPANAKSIAEGQSPQGVSGRNGFGKSGYGGPCPPSGEHRYQFKLYALDATLNLQASATKADLQKAMSGHTVAEAQMMGRYKRGQ